jgi:hypothetical protein
MKRRPLPSQEHTMSHQRLSTVLAALALPFALTTPSDAAPAEDHVADPTQTQTCNEPPPLRRRGDDGVAPLVTGKALKPGTARRTRGTNVGLSPELEGWELLSEERPFEFDDGGGTVKGTYVESIVRGADKRCKSHLQVRPLSGCVSRVVLQGYQHPAKLVADFRIDWDGTVPPRRASRSPAPGTTITFDLKAPVCAGHRSRWLLLNTSVQAVEPLPTLRFVAPDGSASDPHTFHVPLGGGVATP